MPPPLVTTRILELLCLNYPTAVWSPLSAAHWRRKRPTQPLVTYSNSSLVISLLLTFISPHTPTPFTAVAWFKPSFNLSSLPPPPTPSLLETLTASSPLLTLKLFSIKKYSPTSAAFSTTIPTQMHSYNFTQLTRRLSPFTAVDLLLHAWTEPTYHTTSPILPKLPHI